MSGKRSIPGPPYQSQPIPGPPYQGHYPPTSTMGDPRGHLAGYATNQPTPPHRIPYQQQPDYQQQHYNYQLYAHQVPQHVTPPPHSAYSPSATYSRREAASILPPVPPVAPPAGYDRDAAAHQAAWQHYYASMAASGHPPPWQQESSYGRVPSAYPSNYVDANSATAPHYRRDSPRRGEVPMSDAEWEREQWERDERRRLRRAARDAQYEGGYQSYSGADSYQLRGESTIDRPREDRPRDDRARDDRPRDDRPREDRPRDDRPRDDRPRDDRPREDRPRDDRPRDDRPRDDRPRDDRPREDRPRDDRPRDERPREDRHREPREDRHRDKELRNREGPLAQGETHTERLNRIREEDMGIGLMRIDPDVDRGRERNRDKDKDRESRKRRFREEVDEEYMRGRDKDTEKRRQEPFNSQGFEAPSPRPFGADSQYVDTFGELPRSDAPVVAVAHPEVPPRRKRIVIDDVIENVQAVGFGEAAVAMVALGRTAAQPLAPRPLTLAPHLEAPYGYLPRVPIDHIRVIQSRPYGEYHPAEDTHRHHPAGVEGQWEQGLDPYRHMPPPHRATPAIPYNTNPQVPVGFAGYHNDLYDNRRYEHEDSNRAPARSSAAQSAQPTPARPAVVQAKKAPLPNTSTKALPVHQPVQPSSLAVSKERHKRLLEIGSLFPYVKFNNDPKCKIEHITCSLSNLWDRNSGNHRGKFLGVNRPLTVLFNSQWSDVEWLVASSDANSALWLKRAINWMSTTLAILCQLQAAPSADLGVLLDAAANETDKALRAECRKEASPGQGDDLFAIFEPSVIHTIAIDREFWVTPYETLTALAANLSSTPKDRRAQTDADAEISAQATIVEATDTPTVLASYPAEVATDEPVLSVLDIPTQTAAAEDSSTQPLEVFSNVEGMPTTQGQDVVEAVEMVAIPPASVAQEPEVGADKIPQNLIDQNIFSMQ